MAQIVINLSPEFWQSLVYHHMTDNISVNALQMKTYSSEDNIMFYHFSGTTFLHTEQAGAVVKLETYSGGACFKY
jgi:hypothetical protein